MGCCLIEFWKRRFSHIPEGCMRAKQLSPSPRKGEAHAGVGLLLLTLSVGPTAQTATPTACGSFPESGAVELVSVSAGPGLERGPHQQVLRTVTEYRDAAGQTCLHTNSITVLATG
jgi:hypothetical protein